ncbi:MAG TPA: ribonuclease P protein component [Candidatus Andersenbacteria bacterium]|nr:ribonuclease P protein component [Candidatus Andersenbacteria bacterium]
MLKKENRLTKSQDIENIVRGGARLRTKHMVIYTMPSTQGHIRFACVAGKKVHASAVIRHSVQRKIRAACSIIVTSRPGSYDIVVVALTPAIRSMDIQDVVRDITPGLPNV